MNGNKKRNSLYVVAFASVLLVGLFVYSCSTDEYEYADESKTERDGFAQSCAFSTGMKSQGNTLIDSIAASDEFWEFTMSSQLLAEKFDAYASTLSEQEYDKLLSNMNNDDYAEEFIKRANLEKELQQVDIANENLFQRTGFLRLSEDERSQLFRMSAESTELTKPALLKTRKEGGDTSECEKQKKAAYAQAKEDYDNAVSECKKASSSYICSVQAAALHSKNKDIADIKYKECIENK